MGSQTPLDELTPNVPEDDDTKKPKGEGRRSARRKPATTSQRAESELRSRLSGCLDRIAVALETRGDERLADIIREDAEVMSVGLVSMTRPFKALRAPLLLLIAVVEPALAFGRVAREIGYRVAERRMQRAAAREAEAVAGNEGNESNA